MPYVQGIYPIPVSYTHLELGVYGAICGKSLYEGTLDLKEALQAAAE